MIYFRLCAILSSFIFYIDFEICYKNILRRTLEMMKKKNKDNVMMMNVMMMTTETFTARGSTLTWQLIFGLCNIVDSLSQSFKTL